MCPQIHFLPMDIKIEVPEGESILQSARAAGIPINTLCSGNGACGKCRVKLDFPERLNAITLTEKLSLSEKQIAEGYRLACLTNVQGDMKVWVPEESMRDWAPASKEGARELNLISYPARPEFAQSDSDLGIAVDLGTTTLAGYLHNMRSQKCLGSAAVPNPQMDYGADIMSRLYYAKKSGGAEALRKALFEGIDHLVITLLRDAKCDIQDIQRISVVGNSVMHHCLLGYDLTSLTEPPFSPRTIGWLTLKAKEFQTHYSPNFCPETEVDLLPLAGGLVGSDLLAGLLAAGLHQSSDVFLYLDLGTNNEVALGNREKILVSSTSAGPAFEGGALSCGMRARPGAIDHVSLSGEDAVIRTIHHLPPEGLCGSGAVSLLAELLKTGRVNKRGRLLQPNGRLDHRPAFLLKMQGKSVGLTEKDIGELQKAKAAIFAGIIILAKEFGIKPKDISKVYIAGAFGSRLPVAQALEIGIIPVLDPKRIITVGNAAGDGARLSLVSSRPQAELLALQSKTDVINLAMHSEFEKEFIRALFLPHESVSDFWS